MNTKKILISALCVLSLSGCSNPYNKFFHSYGDVAAISAYLEPISGAPKIVNVASNPDEIAKHRQHLYENGYTELGYSSFEAADVKDSLLEEKAQAIGAHIVLRYKNYLRTNSGAVPMTVPDTTRASHTGSIYGANGVTTYTGSSTVYGNKTQYIPFNVARYEYGALFWGKLSYVGLGVYFRDLTSDEKIALDSNKGASVEYVVNDSPAFNADLMRGDLVTNFNGKPVMSNQHLGNLIDEQRNNKPSGSINLTIKRLGNEKIIKISYSDS